MCYAELGSLKFDGKHHYFPAILLLVIFSWFSLVRIQVFFIFFLLQLSTSSLYQFISLNFSFCYVFLTPYYFLVSFLKALFDLENTNQELKSDLRDLFINSAK